MADDVLVTAPVGRGRRVLEAAARKGIRLDGAFWRHDPEEDRWRLVLVARDEDGASRELLLKLVDALPVADLSGVEFKPPSDPVFADLRVASGVEGAQGKRVTSLISGGRYIDDAFLYAL